ncbi:MAG: glycosyltransferase [Acidobacteria bacterium]|nr:glycosyltransferase [Acidobacteriota bacterium]
MQASESAIVTIIIPAWRRADLLRECLRSIEQQSERRFRVTVVSNGGGAAVEDVAREFGCGLIMLPENRGFAVGVNAGLRTAATPNVAVLNDDVKLHADWLKHLVHWLETHPESSFCAGKILSGDGERIDNAGDAVARCGAAWRLGQGGHVKQPYVMAEHAHPLLAASWTAVLLRRAVIEQVGLLDEAFVSYLEDVNYALRCVRAGARGDYLPQAIAYHHGGASSGGAESPYVFRQITRNQLLLLAKDMPGSLLLRNAPRIVWGQFLWMLMGARKGLLMAWASGVARFIAALPGALRNRLRWEPAAAQNLQRWMMAGDAAIYADQFGAQRPAPDTFWRWYFAVFRPPVAAASSTPDAESRRISESSTRPL